MTEKNQYGILYEEINNNLENIKLGKYHYNYKSIDFMFNWKENAKKTIVVFHARVGGAAKTPIFYKNEYENENINVLSIADGLLGYVRRLHNTIYIGTHEIPFDQYYIEIIDFCFKLAKTTKNIFFGSCSGAFPAVYYGAVFHSTIVCVNGYIVIDTSEFETYKKKIKELAGLTWDDYPDQNQHILNNMPEHMYIYQNKNDKFVFHKSKEFIMSCKKNIPNKITAIIHGNTIEGKDAHDVFYPEGETFESIIEKI
jgi:hypothetical protein